MAERVTFSVVGMECPACSMRLESIEDSLEGVLRVEASYLKGRMVVDYDPHRTTPEAIAAEAARMGYPAVVAS